MSLKSLFIREPQQPREPTKAEKRAASLPTYELVSWADQCCSDVGRLLLDWSRDAARGELLAEARLGADALVVLVEELQRREAAH